MKRQKNEKKSRPKKIFSGNSIKWVGFFRKVLFIFAPYIFTALVIGALFGGVAAYALNSNAFILQDIQVHNYQTMNFTQSMRFCGLSQADNLVKVDLVKIRDHVISQHPELEEVRVRRLLPNRLDVYLIRRVPVAQVAISGKYFKIDKKLVVLDEGSATASGNLLPISGAAAPRKGMYLGSTMDDIRVKKAVAIGQAVERFSILRGHLLSRIDVQDSRNIVLWVDDVIEIRLGSGHYIERLKILDQSLKRLELDATKIAYIDLRFDDVVIGPR